MRVTMLAVALALSACAQSVSGEEAQRAANIEQGRRLAEVNCATCHAVGVSGDSHHPEATPFRQLSRNYPVNALEEAFAEGILVGHPDMPEFRMEPEQIEDLLGYIQSIQENQAG